MYCRWESDLHPRENLTELMISTRDHINSLDDHIRLLQKRIKLAENKLGVSANTSAAFMNGSTLNSNTNVEDNRQMYNNISTNKNFCDEVIKL